MINKFVIFRMSLECYFKYKKKNYETYFLIKNRIEYVKNNWTLYI